MKSLYHMFDIHVGTCATCTVRSKMFPHKLNNSMEKLFPFNSRATPVRSPVHFNVRFSGCSNGRLPVRTKHPAMKSVAMASLELQLRLWLRLYFS